MQSQENALGTDERYQIPDELWKRMQALFPPPPKKNKDRPGRPRTDDRNVMNATFYVLRTGCQWKALPKSLGAPSTVRDRFQEWRKAGVFEKIWAEGRSSTTQGDRWEWRSMDTVMTKAPLGGKSTGPNPNDRAKSGTKSSILIEGKGAPLEVVVAGANRHDMRLGGPTLKSIVIEGPKPREHPQNMCLDKGYDFPEIDVLVGELGYRTHVARRGVNQLKRMRVPGHRARRWVVERKNSWMDMFRRLLIRWKKKRKNHLAMIHLA